MEYRTLGNTGLRVSCLGYGASSLGSVFRAVDEQQGIRAVHTALDLGINLIDVSPYYGNTAAESVLGKALNSVPRDSYFLGTKAGRYGGDVFDFSPARLESSVDESLLRLGLDYVDFLHLHDVEFTNLDKTFEAAAPVLERLKRAGKIRFFGVAGFPLNIFRRAFSTLPVDTILSYCHYSLNDTTLLDLLPEIRAHGAALVNASPLSMGLLSRRGPPSWHPAGEDIKTACGKAAAYCDMRGSNIAKLAVQFSTSNPDIPTTLISTANPENMRQNVQWLSEPLDVELLADVLKILEPVKNQQWAQGLPENQE